MRPSVFLVGLALLCGFVLPAKGAETQSVPGLDQELSRLPLGIQADRTDYVHTTRTLVLTGHVLVRYGDFLIRADELTLHIATLRLEASGGVALRAPYGLILGRALSMDLPRDTFELEEGSIELKNEGYFIRGKRLIKRPGMRFLIEDGEMTSCLCAQPRPWALKVKEMEVNFHGMSKGKGAKVVLFEHTAAYLPRFIAPIKKDRQTGFLMPRMAYSDRDGFKFNLPFYLEIARNMDATFAIDYRGRRGVGGDVEYRYIFSDRNYGWINATGFSDTSFGQERRERYDSKKGRFRVDMLHHQDFSDDAYMRADIHYTNDRTMVRDLSGDSDVRTLPYFKTKVGAAYNTEDSLFMGEFRYFQDLRYEDPYTLKQLPHLAIASYKPGVLGTPFTLDFDTSMDYFFSQQGQRGARYDLSPTLRYPTIPFSLFAFEPYAGLRETLYDTTGDVESRELYSLGFRSSSEFLKDYGVSFFNVMKLRHILEPGLDFKHTPNADQARLPYYTAEDDILRQDAFTYSLNNRFYAKTVEGSVREFFRYRIDQTYDLQGNFREPYYVSNRTRHFSNIKNTFEFLPKERLFFDTSFEVNPEEGKANVFGAFLRYDSPRGDSFELAYRYNTEDIYNINGIQTLMEFRLSSMFAAYIGNRYLIGESKNLESVYGIEYNSPCDCFDILFTYEQRVNPDEQEFAVLFNLKGLGFFGSRPYLTRLMDREVDYWNRYWGRERYQMPPQDASASPRHPLPRQLRR
jgi:LPS-assembly protein